MNYHHDRFHLIDKDNDKAASLQRSNMMIANVLGILFQPNTQWKKIADKGQFPLTKAVLTVLILASVPAVAWYYGTTNIGWVIGDGDAVRLTPDSAAVIITLFYFAMVASVCAIGYMIHWMAMTYGSESSTAKGITLAGLVATPLFLTGVIGFFPSYGIDLILGMGALGYAVYLLYTGIPIVMNIPKERGFLFASAVLAFCMVLLMVFMGGSVILWDMGAAPSFTD
jgi:Yip1 domain